MRPFVHDDFLLKTKTAQRLYHEWAEGLPIVEFHCHLDPSVLADDRPFENIAQLWVATDPYKHRAMRMAGVAERLITGDASDRDKFEAWAATVPQTLGNPLFHWTALELQRCFGIADMLSPDNAAHIWEECNARLRLPEYLPRRFLARANVECVCTSDRLDDDLQSHAVLARSGWSTRVLPSLRADDVLAGQAGDSAESLARRIGDRLDRFDQHGCRLADCAWDGFEYRRGDRPSERLRFLGMEAGRRGWILQLHIGAQRHTSSRLRRLAGPAGGYAAIGTACDLPGLCRFLDDLEGEGRLPQVILYPLNPADHAALASLAGSFVEEGFLGKVQLGPPWWYNDHAFGIRRYFDVLANYGLLSAFLGMTTDSRSLLSMCRHEYFRRVLCDWLGDQVEAGAWPADEALLGGLIRKMAHDNAYRSVCGRTPSTADGPQSDARPSAPVSE